VSTWDNYFATPANYYLYNSGRAGAEDDVLSAPYFTFIPWDYDNTFGIDYDYTGRDGTRWQDTDLLDWPSNTMTYWRRNGSCDGKTSRLPLLQNLLRHREFRRYYLDHIEHLLDTVMTPTAVDAVLGLDNGSGLWDRVSRGAYLESDTPGGMPFTGRQFTNDEVYRNGYAQYELRQSGEFALGIHHYLLMRNDSARAQLARARGTGPNGSSGATFPTAPEPLP
jgi:CotH kinase protein